ncbi:MAG: hypothetical protein WCD70_08760, partial [Alphaproteobacteria bacterium]
MKNPPLMIPVRQNPGTQLKNEKRPAASQRYDRNAAIWPQMWMPIRQTSSNRYDPSSANFMTPIKSVTPTAVGKKNWLFIGDADAGQRSAIVYTVIENCRRRSIDPFAYL